MSNQNNQALTKANEELKKKQENLKSMLLKNLPSVASMAGKLMNPERLVRIALVAASRNHKLLECSPTSMLSALMQAAQIGLEPCTPAQLAYLIPRRNSKTGLMEAAFEPSYRGLISVAHRSGEINVWARAHYENDQFHMQYGTDERLDHVPVLDEEQRGDFAGVYAICVMKNGSKQFEYMTAGMVEKIRGRSQSADSGPWVTDHEEMAKKSCIRKILKRIPVSNELALAIEDENTEENDGNVQAANNVFPLLTEHQPEQTGSKGDKLAQQLTSKKKDKGTEAKGDEQPTNDGPPAPMSDEEKAQIIAEEKKDADKNAK